MIASQKVIDYIAGMNAALIDVLSSKKAEQSDSAKSCPCDDCDGRGYLVEYCYYAKPATPNDWLVDDAGKQVASRRLAICPSCLASGVDQEKFVESLKEMSRYEQALKENEYIKSGGGIRAMISQTAGGRAQL